MALPCAARAAPVRLAPADLAVPIGAISAGTRSVKRRGALGAWAELLYNIQPIILLYIHIICRFCYNIFIYLIMLLHIILYL